MIRRRTYSCLAIARLHLLLFLKLHVLRATHHA
jgi:hypothetical protein